MKFRARIEKLVRWTNVLLILCSFLAYLSPYVNPDKFWVLSFFGLAFPWLLLGNLFYVIFWLVKRKRYFLFSLGCILLGWNHVDSFVGLSMVNFAKAEKPLHVMSYNIHGLRSLQVKDAAQRDLKENAFLRFLIQDGPLDVFCAQECSRANESFIATSLQFPYFHRAGYSGAVIFSKHPIVDKGELKFKKSGNAVAWADLQIGEQVVRVYSAHLQSTSVSPLADKVMTEGDLQEKETWLNIKGMLGRVKAATQRRAHQAAALADHLAQSPHPVLLCGDFNDNPQSYSYRLLTRQLNDAFRKKGAGLGTTYAGSIPALRIDYILSDPRFRVNEHSIYREDYSDHYPVRASLSL
ncbi:MAG: endonuclease/exonuclease/phosphatase family protein [Bacteroidota bacterium]